MKKQTHLPPYPNGWYVIIVSKNLKKGQVVRQKFAGQEVVVFRTELGKACVMDAYCPHLGAHLGFGGKVVGECIRCPFHAFEFNTEGTCTKTGYNSHPPAKAQAKVYAVCEQNGVVLIYHDQENNLPTWGIPEIDMEGWLPFEWAEWNLDSHPQEITENSVDIGHFGATHGYSKVGMDQKPETIGSCLTATYSMTRPNYLGKWFKPLDITFKAQAHGLGYSFVEAITHNYSIETRHFVLPMPVEDGKIILRIASSLKKVAHPQKINPLLKVLPRFLLNSLLSKSIYYGYVNDVRQDFKIWENKKYILRAPLAVGDGPIGLYRSWAKQFYAKED